MPSNAETTTAVMSMAPMAALLFAVFASLAAEASAAGLAADGSVADAAALEDGATDAGTTPDPNPGGIIPPRLVESAEPEYPPDARAARLEGTVLLSLTIGLDGRVSEAEIVTDPGLGLGEAARAAALRFRFQPAWRGSSPIPVRIQHAHAFTLPAEPPTARPAPPAPPPVIAPPPASPLTDSPVIEVTARGEREAQRLRKSARAVMVVETTEAKRSSADLGEVMARREGVTVQRSGGLGSQSRFSLNGLTDDQVRFYLDGVPLDVAGFPLGLANVPVNLVERIEVYKGVVPIRYGGDALGGAVDLVTVDDLDEGTRASASYQTGAFGTHRVSAVGRHRLRDTGFVARATGFHDQAENDYLVDVRVPDARGREQPARVRRFHDAYRASGGALEVGWVGRPDRDQYLLRLFVTDTSKELQHNPTMTVPYGEPVATTTVAGTSLRLRRAFGDAVTAEVLAGYSYGRTRLLDIGGCVYTWFGTCAREQAEPGEIGANPRDTLLENHAAYGRGHVRWRLGARQALELSIAPTFVRRIGDERRQRDPGAPDPLREPRSLTSNVAGVEHHLRLFGDRLENIAFAKLYLQLARASEAPSAGVALSRNRQTLLGGGGDSVRLRVARWLALKGSYEYATRLPRADEIFGDGVLVEQNLRLEPEVSHNANLGAQLTASSRVGAFSLEAGGFLRDLDRLILLTGSALYFRYDNAGRARALGVEAAGGWSSPGAALGLDASVTYQDFRATRGTYEGDRIPNRPYLYGSAAARTRLRHVADPRDTVTFTWTSRYVHDFFLTWESLGARGEKATIDAQLVHAAGVTYALPGAPVGLVFSLDVHNVTGARVTDFYGVQRPGRAVFFKVIAEH
jgi:TonB family protein